MKIKNVKKSKLSNWVTLVTNSVEYENEIKEYHSFELHDYTSIIAINSDKKIILVEQFRPAVNKYTLELPGGIVEQDIGPKKTAAKELLEETCYQVTGDIKLVGVMDVDYGRLKNKAFGFFTNNVNYLMNKKVEKGIRTFAFEVDECIQMILDNKFIHSPHVSFMLLAKLKNLI